MKIEVIDIPEGYPAFYLLQSIAAELITLADRMKRDGQTTIEMNRLIVGEDISILITP